MTPSTHRPIQSESRSLLTNGLLMAAIIAALIVADVLLFRHFGDGLLFWRWTKIRPRLPAMAFILSTATSIALFATAFRWTRGRPSGPVMLAFGAAAAVALTAWVAIVYLANFANSGDEYAYYFQALTFEAGRLWNPAPTQGSLVAASFTWVAQGRWVGQYPPVWPAMIALAHTVGTPVWLLNAILLVAAGALLYRIVRHAASPPAAALATLLFLLAPFSLFQAASFFSHLFAGLLVVLAAFAFRRGIESGRVLPIALAGVTIGILANTRSSSALVVALPLGLELLLRRRWRQLAAYCLAGLPFAGMILAYQHVVTGDWFKPVYYFGGRTIDHLYFDPASIKAGAISTIGKLSELSLWVSPVIVPVWLYALSLKLRARQLDALDAIFPLAIGLFVFYPVEPGNRYGPRYYFEFWPMVMATIGTAAPLASRRLRSWLASAAIGSLAYMLVLTPFVGADYATIIEQRTDPYRQVAAARLGHAVVCVDYDYGMLPLGGGDYARNGIAADHPPLFVNCIRRNVDQIRAAFPGYAIYYYRHPRGSDSGRLLRVG